MIKQVCILLVLISTTLSAQDKAAYKIFNKEGKVVDFSKMISEAAKADVVLFGELHDNAIDHWLELQVAKELFASQKELTLGMEMFEADDQLVLNEFLNGTIEEKHLLSEAKVWDNYKNDYKPLVEFAKANKLAVVASNIPRRYANLVYRKGIESLNSLPDEAKKWIAPLPVEIDLNLPGYKNMMSMGGSHVSGENMARSQAMKDATMAYFLLKNRKGRLLHFHGAYHSQNYEGITWYLKKAEPTLKMVTIHSVEQSDIQKLEDANKNTADFIICIPADMTKTY